MKGEYITKDEEGHKVVILTTAHGTNYGGRYDWSAHVTWPGEEQEDYWISSPTEEKLMKRINKILKRGSLSGIKLAKQMKKEGYDDSDIVQRTGYHI